MSKSSVFSFTSAHKLLSQARLDWKFIKEHGTKEQLEVATNLGIRMRDAVQQHAPMQEIEFYADYISDIVTDVFNDSLSSGTPLPKVDDKELTFLLHHC